MTIAVKICGLKDEAAVRAAVGSGADYVGFVHFPASPRHIDFARAAALKPLLGKAKSVCVLVDPDDATLKQAASVLKPDFLQLHGKESPERVAHIKKNTGIKIIKAITVHTGDDVAGAMRYMDAADMLLFDARAPELPGMLPGGNGLSFDWVLLKGRQFGIPWILSGGLTPENVAEAIRASGAQMVDVSSGVEAAPGVKDAALIEAFIQAAKHT